MGGYTWFQNGTTGLSVRQLFVGPYWTATGDYYFEDRARRRAVPELPPGTDYVLIQPHSTRHAYYLQRTSVYHTYQQPDGRPYVTRLPDVLLWKACTCPQGRSYFWHAGDHRTVWDLFMGPFWTDNGTAFYSKADASFVWNLPPGIGFVLVIPTRWDIIWRHEKIGERIARQYSI